MRNGWPVWFALGTHWLTLLANTLVNVAQKRCVLLGQSGSVLRTDSTLSLSLALALALSRSGLFSLGLEVSGTVASNESMEELASE